MQSAHVFGPWPLFAALVLAACWLIGAYAFGPFSYLLAGLMLGGASFMLVRDSERETLTRSNHDEAELTWARRDYLRGWRRGSRNVRFSALVRDALACQGVFALLALLAWSVGPYL